MERSKTVLRVLAALALVAVMAVLPKLAALWQDWGTLGTPATGPIQPVELNFREELPGIALLARVDHAQNWQIVDRDRATMTQEEAEQAAIQAVRDYQAAGLIEKSLQFRTYLVETTALTLPTGEEHLVWIITMLADGKTYGEMNLALDEATGQVMNLQFTGAAQIPEGDFPSALDTFASVFFGGLGIDGYDGHATQELENTYIGGSAVAIRYRFWDPEYGAVAVDLYVYSNGFYTDFYTDL